MAGLEAPSTPSRITGPLPALISSVKIVSITSSFSALPPQVECGRPAKTACSISRYDPERGVRLGHVDDQIVREDELRQRVRAVLI